MGEEPPAGVTALGGDAWVKVRDKSGIDSGSHGGVIEIVPGTGHLCTREGFGDCRIHVEFNIDADSGADWKADGNSGVYIQRRYEMQILDSFGLEGKYNECGALYRQQTPDTNMCLPPLSWQTYDIWFTAARFDDEGDKTANARITVLHNGVPIHSNREILTKTGAGRPEGPEPLPILLQNHSNPVNFRNVWLVHLEDEPTAKAVACHPTRRCRLPRIRRLLRRLFCRRCCRLR